MSKNISTKSTFYKFIGFKEGLATSNGAKWKMRRKMIEPFFVSKQQKIFLPTMDQVFESLVSNELLTLSNKGIPLALSDQIHVTICDIIFKVTLNIPIEDKKENKLHIMQTMDLMEKVTMRRISNPLFWIGKIFYKTELGEKHIQMTDGCFNFIHSTTSRILTIIQMKLVHIL